MPKGELYMTYKELKQKLFDAAQILMELYQDIAARAEPFSLQANSELKKIPITFWRFRGILKKYQSR